MEDRLHLRPTAEQYQAFGEHIRHAHSWYKHLPLLGGRQFVVFVAPDAGIGRLVAVLQGPPQAATGYTLVPPPEGPEFTDEHPRLHHTWKTTKEYRSRFGYLDYMYRQDPSESYARDAGPPVPLPASLEERCSFVLYPYVSGMFSEAVTWSVHADAIAQLRAGAVHPAREEVLELAFFAELHRSAWSALGDSERDWVLASADESGQTPPPDASADLRRYLDSDKRIKALSAKLYDQEAEKVRRALRALDDWLLGR